MRRHIVFCIAALFASATLSAQNGLQADAPGKGKAGNGTAIQSQTRAGGQGQVQAGTSTMTRTQARARLHNQTGTGDRLQKRDQLRKRDLSCTNSQARTKTGFARPAGAMTGTGNMRTMRNAGACRR